MDFLVSMACGGFDSEASDMMIGDRDEDEIVDPECFSMPIQNRFDTRPDMHPGWGNEWQSVSSRQLKKRKKFSSSSMDNESFMSLSNEEKLVCLFETLNKNYDKLSSMEETQRQCIIDNSKVNVNIAKVNKRIDNVETCINTHTQKLKMLSYRSLDIESRSRRNNIVFWGITERLETDCRKLIRNFMRDELDIDPDEMYIERARRLGSLSSNRYRGKQDPKRPIIARFMDYNDTDRVLEKADRLKGSSFGLDRDYPKEIAVARKELYASSEACEGRRNRLRVQIKFPAKLYIEGRLVRDKFPGWFNIMNQSRTNGFEAKIPTNAQRSPQPVSVPSESANKSANSNPGREGTPSVHSLSDSHMETQASPSLLCFERSAPSQNVNIDITQSDDNVLSRESSSHSIESRAGSKNRSENVHLPATAPAQQTRIFKSPVRGRSANKSSNVNSTQNKPSIQKKADKKSKTSQLSKSVEHERLSRSVSKNRIYNTQKPNIETSKSQHGQSVPVRERASSVSNNRRSVSNNRRSVSNNRTDKIPDTNINNTENPHGQTETSTVQSADM